MSRKGFVSPVPPLGRGTTGQDVQSIDSAHKTLSHCHGTKPAAVGQTKEGEMGQAGHAGQMGQSRPALTELCWLQNERSLELIKDKPDGARLAELGQLIRRAERRCLALDEAERAR